MGIPASNLAMALGGHGTALVMRSSRRTPAERRDQLRARISLLESKLMRIMANRTEQVHDIARETIRKGR